tara:strand:- start:279 stop:1913 length:1635 start_codon:yes stop_codon:yes gene_type:complete
MGNFGVGVASPGTKLTVSGAVHITSTANTNKNVDGCIIERNSTDGAVHISAGRTGGNYGGLNFYVAGNSGGSGANTKLRHLIDYQGNFRWYGSDGTTERLHITNGGQVRVMGTNSNDPLYVRGGTEGNASIRLDGGINGVDNSRIEAKFNLALACNGDGNQSNRNIKFYNSTTQMMNIDSDGDVQIGGNLKTNNITGRNLVINGNFMIDQRNDGAELSITSNNKFSADRWTHNNDGFTYYKTQRRNDNSIQTTGEEYYLRITVTTAVTLSGSTSQCIENNLEGYTVKQLNLGTVGAKQCTVSFWVRSSLTGTFGGALQNSAYNRCHPFSYTISSANTWEYKTYTFSTTGFTTGSFLTNNAVGLRLVFSLGNGPGRQANPASGWSNQVKMGPTGETNLVATNGATLDISSVQLEEGTQATKFEHRSYGEELSRCQRYFVSYGNTGHFHFGMGTAYSASALNITVPLPVPMRGEPTVAKISNGSSEWLHAYVGASGTISNPTPQLGESGMSVYRVYVPSAGSGWTAGQSFWCQIRPDARLTFSAEL